MESVSRKGRLRNIYTGGTEMGNDVKKIMEETTKEIVEAQTEHPKKKKKLGGFALYLLGSAVVTVGMAAVMPKMMDKMGRKIYTESLKKQSVDDDWEQRIRNRHQEKTATVNKAEEEKENV
jgi:hypothetical protein